MKNIFMFLLLLAGSTSSLASSLVTGSYQKSSYKSVYLGNSEQKQSDIQISRTSNLVTVRMKEINFSFQLNGSGEIPVSNSVLTKIKEANPYDSFVQNIRKITASNATDKGGIVRFTANIYSQIDSVFGNGAVKVSTDFVLDINHRCDARVWYEVEDRFRTRRDYFACSKLTSGVNTRLSDIEIPFGSSYKKIIGFSVDVALKLSLGFLRNDSYLIKN